MAIALFFDVHIDQAIANQLRLRQVEVLTAQEEGATRLGDEQLLDHATVLGRSIVTHDIRFLAMAGDWQRQRRPFCGLIFAHLVRVSIAQCVRDLELIAKTTDPVDWASAVLRLPL
jgi:predicted nuclease of predicted toxin-antitoxin system